jgi:hypothetical protein
MMLGRGALFAAWHSHMKKYFLEIQLPLVALLVSLGVLATVLSPPPVRTHASELRPMLLRPAFARTVSKPFLPLLVELLWLRSLNAIGMTDSEQKNSALYEYGVTLSELDPRFFEVYEFIGLAIPYAVSRNTWSGAAESSDIFRRGLKAFPTSLKLHMYLGFELMHRERKYSEAGDVFARAAKLPDALDYMGPLAVRLKAHSGRPEEGLEITRELLANTSDENMRKVLEQRVRELEVEQLLQQIDRAVGLFKAEHGRLPTSLEELRTTGFYQGPMADEFGGPFSIDEAGKGKASALPRRLEIYE